MCLRPLADSPHEPTEVVDSCESHREIESISCPNERREGDRWHYVENQIADWTN